MPFPIRDSRLTRVGRPRKDAITVVRRSWSTRARATFGTHDLHAGERPATRPPELAGTASLRGYQSESLCRMRLR
jgi:hypothetical protein